MGQAGNLLDAMDKWDACAFKVANESLRGVYVTVTWTYPPPQTLRLLYWCSRHWTRMTNMWSFRTSGYRKIRWSFVCAVTMFLTMSGSDKASCRPSKTKWFITATLKNSLSSWVKNTISEKSPLTAGVLSKWCRT